MVRQRAWLCPVISAALLLGCDFDLSDATVIPKQPPEPAELTELLACAGPDMVVTRALPVSLDGRCSRVLGSAEVRDRLWRQREGERVTLDSAVSALVRLSAPPRADALVFGLELRGDALLGTDSTRIVVVDGDPLQAPLAVASGDLVTTDDSVVLDASRSTGLDAALQTARWTQVIGGTATLEDASALRTSLHLGPTTDAAVFALEVQDANGLWSEPDFVVVDRREEIVETGAAPELAAPPFVEPGATVVLRPSTPADPSAGLLALRQIRGDAVTWNEQADGSVVFVAPRRPQGLAFRLDQEQEGRHLAPAVAVIQVTAGIGNRAPVADAGPDRSVRPDRRVALAATRSHDPDGTVLHDHRWWQVQGPAVSLACHDAVCTFDAPAQAVILAFALVVDDGVAASNPDVVVITVDPLAQNQPPVAQAGGEHWALPGSAVRLDGSRSDDPDSGRIASSLWEQLPPLEPAVELQDLGGGLASFMAPATPTTLHFQLTVCDAEQACSSDLATVHVEVAGPYVDPARGLDDGDGSPARPARTPGQGLVQVQRFGFGELRLAAGNHAAAQALRVPANVRLSGGWVFDDGDYTQDGAAVTALGVPGIDAVSLESGSSLAQIRIHALAATAVVPRRRLLVMGPRTRLIGVEATGPTLAEESWTVDVGEGHRVEIRDCVLRGGIANNLSTTLDAGPSSDVLLQDSRIELGRAPLVFGVRSADGKLVLERASLGPGDQLEAARDVTGLDVVRSELLIESSTLALDDGELIQADLAVTLRCHKCQPTLTSDSSVRGPRKIRAEGRGVAVSLFFAVNARLSGELVGGAESPTADLVALEVAGGDITLTDASLRASADGQAATAVALSIDSAQASLHGVSLHAAAVGRAIGAQLVGLQSSELELVDLFVVAASSWGIVDGWLVDLSSPTMGSDSATLAVAGTLQVVGAVDATGLALRGSQWLDVELADLRVSAPQNSTGIQLQDVVDVRLGTSQVVVEADAELGVAQAVSCQGMTEEPASVQLERTRLTVSASLATGLALRSCQGLIVTSVIRASGQVDAQAVHATSPVRINSSYLAASGASRGTVVLGDGATGELRNSIVKIAQAAAALEVSEGPDQWLALHHVMFAPGGRTLMTQLGLALADDDVALSSLRSRFRNLSAVDDVGIDSSGHLTSALSPAVDAADPITVSLLDIDGQPRPMGAGPDIGPDEAF
ncbi:MAG: hypothetical protein ABIJ09_01525 [Pseudomonadota bacterium]